MSFFISLLQKNNLQKHDGRPLWKYLLDNDDFEKLLNEFKYSSTYVDPRDATLYYAEWWKKNYNGGVPGKMNIFKSLSGSIKYKYNHEQFYNLAKKGARMLGIKWITKQNTLYFRTLLLQGGLPLLHISENHGKYQDFLLAVLDEQPDTVEDFMFNPSITYLLPKSSQNDIIYESCFEIVKSILNDENIYDDLLNSSEVLSTISNKLKVRKQSLKRKQRLSKPKNYWLLGFKKKEVEINLRIGLADKYNKESLSNILGFEAMGDEYQLYVNDDLICVFRKMINGNFKTDWHQQLDQKWNGESNLPYTYVIKEGKKYEVTDFIQTIPNLYEPSLWTKYSDNEWRLIKGNGTSNKEASLLLPLQWRSDLQPKEIVINNKQLSWLTFEGEIEIKTNEESRKYFSETNSFDWTIVSQKPNWMLKSSMPVVQKKPNILIYDENNKILNEKKYKIWLKKYNSYSVWEEFSSLKDIPLGCIKIKIEKDGLIAHDTFYNIGTLQVRYNQKAIDNAKMEILNLNSFEFQFDESPILEIENENNNFSLKVNTKYSKIPTGINGSISQRGKKKVFFEIASPFEGMTITDKGGGVIAENEKITISSLYGLRILSTPNTETILRIKNKLKTDVIISKEIKESSQPVISFKDEILRLFYLADAMDYRNKVSIELIESRNSKTYEIYGFSHTLNVDNQFQNNVSLYDSDDELDLYAIPLNCSTESIELIPLIRDELSYTIPTTEITNQFIVISTKEGDSQLMPRFVNTDENFEGLEKDERINQIHSQLLENNFDSQIWKQLLAYFNICIENQIPFSTFDQLRAISRSSLVASRAFFLLGANQSDKDSFIQKFIPEIEQDLGFCFHWIKKDDWLYASDEINKIYQYQYFDKFIDLINTYMQEIGLPELLQYINGGSIQSEKIMYSDIHDLRAKLGERVLKELPVKSPKITKNYNISIKEHYPVKLLLRSPIAVAESINNTQQEYPIWAGEDFKDDIRRNIQYSQYLNPDFYNKTIIHVLKEN